MQELRGHSWFRPSTPAIPRTGSCRLDSRADTPGLRSPAGKEPCHPQPELMRETILETVEENLTVR